MEVGVSDAPVPTGQAYDFGPTDIIELSKDFFQPSASYSEFFKAVQKDMTLGYLSERDIKEIELRFGNIEDCVLLLAKNPDRWGYLEKTKDYYLAWIAMRVTMGRGKQGFTAKLMRSTFTEQHASIRQMEGVEKRKQSVAEKARRFVGI